VAAEVLEDEVALEGAVLAGGDAFLAGEEAAGLAFVAVLVALEVLVAAEGVEHLAGGLADGHEVGGLEEAQRAGGVVAFEEAGFELGGIPAVGPTALFGGQRAAAGVEAVEQGGAQGALQAAGGDVGAVVAVGGALDGELVDDVLPAASRLATWPILAA
jgi:hypothetical protein